MAFRHYEGGGLPGTEVKKVSPPPSAPPKRVELLSEPVQSTVEALDALEVNTGQRADETKDHLIYALELCHLPSNTAVSAQGMSPEDALQAAIVKLDAALPIRALVWDDGSPVEGLARQILSEALEQFAGDLRADPQVALMIGRLKGALGEV